MIDRLFGMELDDAFCTWFYFGFVALCLNYWSWREPDFKKRTPNLALYWWGTRTGWWWDTP